MGLEGYQLRYQLGAGRDGIAFRATAADGVTTVLVLDLARGRADSVRWARLVPRLRLAAQATRESRAADRGARSRPRGSERGAGMGRRDDSRERGRDCFPVRRSQLPSCFETWPRRSPRPIAWGWLTAGLVPTRFC